MPKPWLPFSRRTRDGARPVTDAPEINLAIHTPVITHPLARGPQIVVVGAVVMDFLLKIPAWPQPDEAVQGAFSQAPGGKGLNQAVACARLAIDRGKKIALVSSVAEDELGDRLCKLLDQYDGIDARIARVSADSNTHTDVTAVLLGDGLPGFIGCRAASNFLTAEALESYRSLIADSEVVCVTCDVPLATARRAVQIATAARRRIILNAAPPPEAPSDLDFFDGVDYLVLSDSEARRWLHLAGKLPSQGAGPLTREQLSDMLAEYGPLTIVITSGSRGCFVRTGQPNAPVERHRAFSVEESDMAGTNDAFCAALAVALLENRPQSEHIPFASAAAALASTVEGAYSSMPDRASVEEFLQKRQDELVGQTKLERYVRG